MVTVVQTLKTFAIASPYGGPYCYDYVVYLSLRKAMESLGLIYDKESPNRVYLLGYPLRPKYISCGAFDPNNLNIALIGSGLQYTHGSPLEDFDFVFTSSPISYNAFMTLTGRKPDGLWNLYSPFEGEIPEFKLTDKTIDIPEMDIAFVGNARARQSVEALMQIIDKHPEWSFNYYGANIDKYQGNPKAKKYWTGDILPYHQFPDLAKKAKIVLMDMHDDMSQCGMPSFKLIDMLMCKAFVMTYGNTYCPTLLKSPTFSSPAELENMITLYLSNKEKREKIIRESHRIVKRVHTVNKTASQLVGLINSFGR